MARRPQALVAFVVSLAVLGAGCPASTGGGGDAGSADDAGTSGHDGGTSSDDGGLDGGSDTTGWWDDGWAYRRKIVVQAAGAALPEGYSVSITLDHAALVADGGSRADGADLRVVCAGVEHDRALDDLSAFDTASTVLWFELDAAVPADTTYDDCYLYYGNPSAGPAPAYASDSMGADDASRVFLAADDFAEHAAGDHPDGWTDEGTEHFEVADHDGARWLHQTTRDAWEDGTVATSMPEASDAVWSVRLDYVQAGDNAWGGLGVRVGGGSGHVVVVRDGGWLLTGEHFEGGAWSSESAVHFPVGTTGRLDLVTSGSTLDAYWHNPAGSSPAVVTLFTGQEIGAGSGRLAVHVERDDGAGNAHVVEAGDVVTRLYVRPEPTVVLGGEETPGSGPVDVTAPVLSNGQPVGILPSGTTQATLSVRTDEPATCRWGDADAAYAALPSAFATTGGTSHEDTLSGLADGTSYTIYVRCEDAAGNANDGSYAVAFSVASGAVPGELPGLVDDGLSHPPPAVGPYAYNAFVPPTTPGASYVDPVFGATVRRLSSDGNADDIYARNMWWSADGTRYLHRNKNGTQWADYWDVVDTHTGVVTHEAIPIGYYAPDAGFDPVDPNVLYRVQRDGIERITLAGDGTWTVDTAFTPPGGAQLKDLGGTVNWLDASGRYMVVRYGPEPSVYLYDRQNLAAGPYANPIDGSKNIDRGSYVGVTPDGKYLIGWDYTVDPYNLGSGTAWPIDHANRSIGTNPTHFWSLCGDHATFISASDGRDYMIAGNCYSHPEVWRIDVTNEIATLDEAGQMAAPGNMRLLAWPNWGQGNHFSAVAKGPLRDWVFVSAEAGDDGYDAGADDGSGFIAPWFLYKQEIIGIDVLTGEVRRLAHHRSRDMGQYYNTPRLSVSWGGEYVGFASNFDQQSGVNVFAIPFGVAP